MKLAFIGLGVMGYPMAGHLKKSGYDISVYNRTVAKAEKWAREFDGHYANTPALAAENADVVMLCVGNDDDVKEMVLGKPSQAGILAQMAPDSVIVDHTTTSDSLAKELASITANHSVHFIDAPVSGGQQGAENGKLAIMTGGQEAIVQRVRLVLDCYASSVKYMGPSGSGQATKMVNQVLIAGILQGMSEGFALAEKAQLNLPDVIDAISGGAAGSWQLNNRGTTISEDFFDYGFAVDWMRKDLKFCLDAATRMGLSLPNTAHVDKCYEQLQQQGFNRCDTSVLVKQYK